jgi:hypothetical protein
MIKWEVLIVQLVTGNILFMLGGGYKVLNECIEGIVDERRGQRPEWARFLIFISWRLDVILKLFRDFRVPFPPNLRSIILCEFYRFKILPTLPTTLEKFKLNGCKSIIEFPLLPPNLKELEIHYCHQINQMAYLWKELGFVWRYFYLKKRFTSMGSNI